MASDHRRFLLRNVTFAGRHTDGATIDAWLGEDGTQQWAARVVLPTDHAETTGVLIGTTREGRRVTGQARVAGAHAGPRGRRTSLVDLYGSGPLREDDGTRHGG